MDDNNGEDDHISKLPDDLLHRILSLLDMKQVVQTSILSSRWGCLWISMPSFNFNQVIFKSCKTVNSNSYRFVKFVDMVLQGKTSIQNLVLSCVSDYFVGSEQVYKWIVDAVRLKVSVLELQIVYGDFQKIRPLTLPLCLFTCKTLTTLKLDLGFLKRNTLILSLPADSVCLTGLKTLHLSSLLFIGEESTDTFFSRCPVLETLIISYCQFTETYKGNYLPSSIFSCETLVSLKLKMSWKDGPIFNNLPDSMSLPALKTLHFESLLLNGKDLITNLLTSCPVMESLTIMSCEFYRVNVNISSHKLWHLTLVNNKIVAHENYFPNYAAMDYENKINAPNLTSFICKESKDHMLYVYTIENLSSIVKVVINFDMEEKEAQSRRYEYMFWEKRTYATTNKLKKQLYAQQMMKIMGVLHNVKDLTLSAWFLEVVSGALDLPDSPTIQFCNLGCLKLRTWCTMDRAHAVMYLLDRSPNIESLSVEFAEIPSWPYFEKNPTGKNYWEERLSLNCMLHHLTSVKLQAFCGCYPELKFVEFLLKNAMNLQKLMICFVTIKDPTNNVESRVVKVSEEEVLSEDTNLRIVIVYG